MGWVATRIWIPLSISTSHGKKRTVPEQFTCPVADIGCKSSQAVSWGCLQPVSVEVDISAVYSYQMQSLVGSRNTIPHSSRHNSHRESGRSFDEELHFETAYVLVIFPHPCEHICHIDNSLIPASLQSWSDTGDCFPTASHISQLQKP